jgi:hypothetical protein
VNEQEGSMAQCDLIDSCLFFNSLLKDMPCTAEYLVNKYCKGDFTACTLYKYAKAIGKDYVPKYLYPNDMYETLNHILPKTAESQEALPTMTKVIHTDGTLGMVRSSRLGALVKSGGIVAYRCTKGWVEVRRKRSKGNYTGPERRKTSPETAMRA